MVLVLEDDNALIHIRDEMPEGTGEKYLFSLPPSSSVQDLFTAVASRWNYAPQSYDLLLVNDFGEHEMTLDEEKNLKEAGLLFGPENQNSFKIVPPKAMSPPSIVISLANKAEESYDSLIRPRTQKTEHRTLRRVRSDKAGIAFAIKSKNKEMERDTETCYTEHRYPTVASTVMDSNTETVSSYVGLVNQAMTCYLNSLLQALYMTPEFRNALYKWKYVGSAEETQKSIPYQLQRLFLSLQTSKRSAIETSKLTKSFGWDASDSWQQHDIQELCRVMFDALEQKFKDTDQADFINNLYQGKLIDYVSCLECRTEKTRVDTFLDIPLPVRPFGSTVAYNSVAEAMHAFIQPETLDGNNQYFCETCNKKCDAHKGLKFSHFPYILTLHLKRFDFDYNAMSRIKLTDRVEFPNVLNINRFLCDEAKSLIKDEAKPSVNNDSSSGLALEETSGPGNDQVACEPSTKGDDMSTTDSASTLEDEGCQGTEPSDALDNMHGSTSGSNSSGSNVDMQDYDEGIDLSNGTSNQHQQENEKNRRHTEGEGPPGPFIYELFSIMIHSGSASGGHYYVYIKDFDRGEWFCFDDQSVSRITNEDISMTYGGGTHRGYYSGAHSSSTNAYMLMYRQIDKTRNQSVMSVDEFPPHMKELMKSMQEEEEEERILRERDRDRLKIKVYCRVPGDDHRFEAKLVIDGDTTLAEATAVAHKLFILDGIVPLEQCRLVSYDSTSNTIDCSFDDQDSETMGYIYTNSNIQNPNAQSLYLEIREADAQFESYRPGGVVIKVYRVHMDTKEVDLPVDVRTQLTTSFGEMRPQIEKALKLTPNIILMMEKYGSSPIELDDDKNLQSAGFYSINKIFVAEVSESQPESDFIYKMSMIIERFGNTITLYCTLPDTDIESLAKLGIAPISAPEVLKISNGECEAAGDSVFAPLATAKGTSRGTSPQLPLLDGEEECLGATGCSDQSTSEDSSLTDSDRTIVGDEAEFCLAELSSASNSPDQPNVSSPDEKESSPILRMKRGEKVVTAEKDGESWTDEELWNSGYYYLKIHPCKTQDLKKMVRVQIDKRMIMGTLKSALAQHLGISADYIKLFRKCGNNELPYSRLQDPLSSLRDEERIIVRLERALRLGEYRGKVYQLLADEEPIKFLCDWILTKEMLVGEAKKQILDELKRKEELDIPYDRCRLRGKKWKNPGKIFLDSQSFQDTRLTSNWEIFLQELSEPETVTSPSQVTIMLRKYRAFDNSLDGFHEITLQSPSFTELRETLSETSGISLDSLEFARPLGNFPFMQLNNNQAQTEFLWETVCNCNLEDGTVLYYRNKDDDGSADSSDKNGGERYTGYNQRLLRSAKFVASDKKKARKEKALRIVVSPSPNSAKENSGADE